MLQSTLNNFLQVRYSCWVSTTLSSFCGNDLLVNCSSFLHDFECWNLHLGSRENIVHSVLVNILSTSKLNTVFILSPPNKRSKSKASGLICCQAVYYLNLFPLNDWKWFQHPIQIAVFWFRRSYIKQTLLILWHEGDQKVFLYDGIRVICERALFALQIYV